MSDDEKSISRETKIEEGNYNENIKRNYNKAETIINIEKYNCYLPNKETKKKEQKTVDHEEKIPFSFAGSIKKEDVLKLKNLLQLVRKLADDDCIVVVGVEEGTIKLTLKGSQVGLKRLEQLFQSGELTRIFEQELNITVEDVSFIDAQTPESYQKEQSQKLLAFTIAGNVSQADIDILKAALIDTSDNDEEIKNEEKSRLIEEIRTKGAVKRNLRNADLRGLDLSYANLRSAILFDADLSYAFLSYTNLSGANVKNACFINSRGISKSLKQDLKARGAIFGDSQGVPLG